MSANTVYSASAWFYSVAGYGTGAQVAITWYNSGGTLFSTVTSGALAIPAATWTQVTELNQTSPGTAAFAAVTVQFSGTPSATAYWVAEAALVSGALAVSTGLVTTGVPLRIRAAIGTIGGVTANRWYVIQRNAEQWPQQIDAAYRRFVTVTATDIWSALAAPEPTPYRGEVIQDAPYAWWAMDDQPLSGGVQPTSLRNSAPGNTNTLTIYGASGGVTAGDSYTTSGYNATTDGSGINGLPPTNPPPSVAVYAAGQQQGWMFGDPQSSQSSYGTYGSPVTASPGSAAWQQTGLLGHTGQQRLVPRRQRRQLPPAVRRDDASACGSTWASTGPPPDSPPSRTPRMSSPGSQASRSPSPPSPPPPIPSRSCTWTPAAT